MVEARVSVPGTPLDGSLCAHCRVLNPHKGESRSGRISIQYNRVDQYPHFPELKSSAGRGCAFCGLLRHALLDKYGDEKMTEAENDFSSSIRAEWSMSEWSGQVNIDGAVFSTEEDWPERDASQAQDQHLCNVHSLSLKVWPYPPRRKVNNPESNSSWVWFAVYADSGG